MIDKKTGEEYFELDIDELVNWIFGEWYPERFKDPWWMGVGYGPKNLVEIDGILWSGVFYNPPDPPQVGEWVAVEIQQDEIASPFSGRGEQIPLIKEQLTEQTADRLVRALEKIKRIQGLDFAEGLCQLVHVYLFMSDWLRTKQRKRSCFDDLRDSNQRRLGSLEGVFEMWDTMRDVSLDLLVEGFSLRRAGNGGMPCYRTIPHGWLSFGELNGIYNRLIGNLEELGKPLEEILGDPTKRYPIIPVTVRLNQISQLEDFIDSPPQYLPSRC